MAFFIYGIFSPSWASRLWYNIRTFPQRVTSWISDQSFLDYDSYKSDIKKVWDKLDDAVDKIEDNFDENDDNLDEDLVNDDSSEDSNVSDAKDIDNESKNNSSKDNGSRNEKSKNDKSSDKNVIKSFPESLKFVNMPILDGESDYDIDNESDYDNKQSSTSYSKSEILKIISKYVENNLNENTDILVTVEYQDDGSSVERIILQTQADTKWYKENYVIVPDKKNNNDLENMDSDNVGLESKDSVEIKSSKETKSVNSVQKTTTTKKAASTQKSTSTKLTTKDQKDAEEIFSALF